MYDGMLAESIKFPGDGGDLVEGYFARPLGPGPYAAVVVLHHTPGFDATMKEITRTFAVHDYVALCPNLYWREAPSAEPADAAEWAMAKGGVPDDRLVGDVGGATAWLRSLPYCNGMVGVIGYCSGGRQAFLAACSLDLDAAIDCYGAYVTATPPEGSSSRARPIVHMTSRLSCPLLGLFGEEDQYIPPDQVDDLEAALKDHSKIYALHRYGGAGHGFFNVDRPAYRVEAAQDGWQRVWDFFWQYLRP